MITPVALAVLAVLLAWPVPVVLSRSSWPAKAPVQALLLWQAIAVAGGLSMIGALLTFGLALHGTDLAGGIAGLLAWIGGGADATQVRIWNVLALSGAALLTVHLVLNVIVTVLRSERQRRRHARLLAVLSSPLPAQSGARLIDSPAPIAYCLPGALTSVTVVSAGLVALLDDDELRAVIEHERAHVYQRHDVVLILFRAWRASLPWFPIASLAQREVGMLVEMLADDFARRTVSDRVLARTIALVGAGQDIPLDDLDERVPVEQLSARIVRLQSARPPLPALGKATVIVVAVALLLVPTALLLAPAAAAWS